MRGRHVILLAKSAIAAQPLGEMARLAAAVTAAGHAEASFAFTEQGQPSLRDQLDELAGQGVAEIALVPLMLPMEPSMRAWLTRAVHRWRAADEGRRDILVRIGPGPADLSMLAALAAALAEAALAAEPVPAQGEKPLGSVVPDHARRVLVCQGGPCNDVGAALVWGRLRNEQARLGLRETASMMSAKTSCLGPCNLAPVVQVYPEGVYYGGVDEAGIDRIIAEHLVGGQVVEDLAYAPGPGKQRLRSRP